MWPFSRNPNRRLERLARRASQLQAEDKLEKAIDCLTEAAEIAKRLHGCSNAVYAEMVGNRGGLYARMGNLSYAELLLQDAIRILEGLNGENFRYWVCFMSNLAVVREGQGHLDQALETTQAAAEKATSENGVPLTQRLTVLRSLADLHRQMGSDAEAESVLLRAIADGTPTYDEIEPLYVDCLGDLADLYEDACRYPEEEPLRRTIVEIHRQVFDRHDPTLGQSVFDLAEACGRIGLSDEAVARFREAFVIWHEAAGPGHAMTLHAIDSLGRHLTLLQKYEEAQKVLELYWNLLTATDNEESEWHAKWLLVSAALSARVGDHETAEEQLLNALELFSGLGLDTSPGYIATLTSLADIKARTGDKEGAETLFVRALELRREVNGPRHSSTAYSLLALGREYVESHRLAEGLPLLLEAQQIYAELGLSRHPAYALLLQALAEARRQERDYEAAEQLLREEADIFEASEGRLSPSRAECLSHLAFVYANMGRLLEGTVLMHEVQATDDLVIDQVVAMGGEKRWRECLDHVQDGVFMFLSFVSQLDPLPPQVVEAALDLVLVRKGLEAATLTTQRDCVLGENDEELSELLAQHRETQVELARTVLSGPQTLSTTQHAQIIDTLKSKQADLARSLSSRLPDLNLMARMREGGSQVLSRSLPSNTVFVEFVRFAPLELSHNGGWLSARYLAFVVRRSPGDVAMVDLGDAETIDSLVSSFRGALTGQEESLRGIGVRVKEAELPWKEVGARLAKAIVAPLEASIAERTELIIAPDGNLAMLPFGILPLNGEDYLGDHFRVRYVGVGRDLLRSNTRPQIAQTPPLFVGAPDFDWSPPSGNTTVSQDGDRWSDVTGFEKLAVRYDALPQAAEEVELIARQMPGASVVVGSKATKGCLRTCRSPAILHIATHGFFLSKEKPAVEEPDTEAPPLFHGRGASRPVLAGSDDPMIRAGLVFAGVNTWARGGELPEEAGEGILTAAEIVGMDLRGTELVVLSACDTGIGEVLHGEGVFGLTRAFVLAGARTVIASMWKVDDEHTSKLMQDFYGRLLEGEPRAEALRQSQLALREKAPAPAAWGAFICHGDAGPLPDNVLERIRHPNGTEM